MEFDCNKSNNIFEDGGEKTSFPKMFYFLEKSFREKKNFQIRIIRPKSMGITKNFKNVMAIIIKFLMEKKGEYFY